MQNTRERIDKDDTMEQLTMQRFKERIARENAERVKKNLPVAKYDVELKRAYLEYADGSRQYIKEAESYCL